jgi:radical SAM family RiPP maturation amino acid epimerase
VSEAPLAAAALAAPVVKRFAEWWRGDARFRAEFVAAPEPALRARGLELPADALSLLCVVPGQRDPDVELLAGDPRLAGYSRYLAELERASAAFVRRRESLPAPVVQAWRARQMARVASEAPTAWSDGNAHLVFAIELCDGCSVGCSYCGGAAHRLRSVARFREDNERLFRTALRTVAELSGLASPAGILYHFTEPLDNPDYERYLLACRDELGEIPQTTTAAWQRNPARTRRLIELSSAQAGLVVRFSINSLADFHRCMDVFGADELARVRLVFHYPEAFSQYYSSGRGAGVEGAVPGSCVCVTGFLVNLARRTVELVAPCVEPERWPLGHRVLARGRFAEPASLERLLRRCVDEVMSARLGAAVVPMFRADLRVSSERDTVTLTSACRRIRLGGGLAPRLARQLDGRRSVAEVVGAFPGEEAAAEDVLQAWWERGLLEDSLEPAELTPD